MTQSSKSKMKKRDISKCQEHNLHFINHFKGKSVNFKTKHRNMYIFSVENKFSMPSHKFSQSVYILMRI